MVASDDAFCETPGGAHAASIERMIESAPLYRPDAPASDLVADFAEGDLRLPAFLTLYSRGVDALPAVREGFGHPNWQVRRWCALFADNFADSETLHALVPLLRDPRSQVRLWAVHSLACETCKDGPNPLDSVPLLIERIELDESIRVRRQAVAMLAHHLRPDARVLTVFRRVLDRETDRRLLLHAERGVRRYAEVGLRV